MKLRKLTAFLVSLSMLVGLILVAPASAAITSAEGTYYEETLLDLDFDTEADQDGIAVANGIVEEGKLKFELSALSSLVINEGLDKNKKQYAIEFDLETDNEYTDDPWSATFIGLRLHGASATPDGEIKGTWLGIFKNKLVFWTSYEGAKWGRTADGADYYKVLDIPETITDEDGITDLSSASYRIVYEKDEVDVFVKDGESYEKLANFNILSNDIRTKYGVFTAGETTYETKITFTDATSMNYFALYNVIPEVIEDDPLAPMPEEEEEAEEEEEEVTYPLVALDNLKVFCYNGKLATLSLIEDHMAYVDVVVGAFDPMPEEATVTIDEVTYRTYGIDIEKVIEFQDKFAEAYEAIENEEALETDVKALVSDWIAEKAGFVTDAAAISYVNGFAGMEETLESVDAEEYDAAKIASVSALIEEAKAIVDGTEVFNSETLDEAFANVSRAFKNLGIITPNGVVAYRNSMTGALSTSEWQSVGNMAANSAEGYGFSWTGNLGLGFKKKYTEPYSAKVTTKIANSSVTSTFFGIRQNMGDNWHEHTNSALGANNVTGTGGISLQTPYGSPNFNKIRIVVKAGVETTTDSTKLLSVVFDITDFVGEGKTEATFILKDFGDLVEAYVVGTEGDYAGKPCKFGSVVIYPGISTVGRFANCYSAGKIINHLDGDSITEFTGMAIHTMENGVIALSYRGGISDGQPDVYYKDFEIATDLCVAEMTEEERASLYYFDGKKDPLHAELVLGNGDNFDVSTSEPTKYMVKATNDEEAWVKVAGHKNEYATGSVAVTTSEKVSISAEYGEEILSIDKASTSILGNIRGTDIVTVSYGDITKDKYLVNSMSIMEKEFGFGVVAPEEGAVFEGTIVSSSIHNARVFRCLNVGDKVIPAVSYALGNGELRFLGTDKEVVFEVMNPEDATVMTYDAENGVFKAMAAGTAKVRAKIPYTTLGGVTGNYSITPWVNVEVVESGAVYGESMTVANQDLLATVSGEKTLEEKKQILDEAAEAGIAVSYENDTEAELIYAALESAKAVNDELDEGDRLSDTEVVAKALVEAEAVISVYEVISEEEATADELEEVLFGTDGVSRELGLSSTYVTKFGNLKNSKASNAMKSLLRLAKNEGTDLTADFLRTKFKKVVKDQLDVEGGGGTVRVEITTDDNTDSGSFRPAASATVPTVTKADKYKLDEASVNTEIAKFADAKDASWASAAIAALSRNGVVKGYEDGTIRPNETITRDEFVTLLVKAFEITTKSDAVNYYKDIPAGSWQIPYVAAATEAGIVNGMEALTFGAGKEVSRQDMATMIYKAAVKFNVTLPQEKMVAFNDAENISGYAIEAVNRLAAAGVVSGMGDDVFAPGQVATRAQAFQMIYAIMLLVK